MVFSCTMTLKRIRLCCTRDTVSVKLLWRPHLCNHSYQLTLSKHVHYVTILINPYTARVLASPHRHSLYPLWLILSNCFESKRISIIEPSVAELYSFSFLAIFSPSIVFPFFRCWGMSNTSIHFMPKIKKDPSTEIKIHQFVAPSMLL